MVALFHASCHEEQHASDQTVGHHPEHGRVRSERRQRRDAEHDESHVCNRGERDQTLHVGLGKTAECAVDDADDGKCADVRRPFLGSRREDRDRDANEPVRSQLQQDRGQDDRALRRGLSVRIWQPRVEGEHRHLDGESDEHSSEDPDLQVLGNRRTVLDEIRNREAFRTSLKEQCEERNQHQRGTEHRVKEELERCVLTVLATPHTNHEVHRQEHQFEEHEEQDEVLGDERTRHAGLQDQHQGEERLRITRRRHVIEAVDHDEQRDHHRQEVQRQADSVEADEVRTLDERNPLGVGDELHRPRLIEVEAQECEHPDGESRHGGEDGNGLDHLFLGLRHEHHEHNSHQR